MRSAIVAGFLLCLAAIPTAEAQMIRVTVAPPAVRAEPVPRAPSPRHLWVRGYWQWDGHRHVWVPGRYQAPPAAGQSWVPARWANEGGGWVFYEGHWGQAAPVVVAPPPPVVIAPHPPRPVVVAPPPPVVVAPRPAPVIVVQPSAPPPPPPPDHDHGWKGKGKGWKGKGKGWKGKGKGHW